MKLFTIFLSILISTAAVADDHGNSATGAEQNVSGDNPFILIARVQVKEGMVDQYLRIAEAVDNAVEKNQGPVVGGLESWKGLAKVLFGEGPKALGGLFCG